MAIVVRPRRDDYGARLLFNMKDQDNAVLDLSAATAAKIYLIKPGTQTPASLDGTIVGDGTAGQIEYITPQGQLDVDGVYSYEPEAQWATARLAGTPLVFEVDNSNRPTS